MWLPLTVLDRPTTLAARHWLVQAHLWVGLTVGIVITVLGLSGSLIVFRQEIYRRVNAPLMYVEPTGERKPLQEQADRVMEGNPGGQLDFIELPQGARESTEFSLRFQNGKETREATAYVNPYTAEILPGNPRELRSLNWLVRLHHNLLAGRAGRVVEGVVSLFFLWLCVSGVVIWWPGRPHWKRNLTVNARLRGWPLALSFHKAVGIWAVLILAMFATTAISFTWNIGRIFDQITHSSPRKTAPPETSWKRGDGILPLDAYLARLTQEVSRSTAVYVVMPSEQNRSLRIGFRMPEDFDRAGAENSAYLDPRTGVVLGVELVRNEPFPERVQSSFEALHFGRFGIGLLAGLPVKVVWAGMGTVPGALFYTGFLPWWNLVVKRRWVHRNA